MYRTTSLLSGDTAAVALCHVAWLGALLVFAAPASARRWTATLSGAVEAPPNVSPGSGFVLLDLDDNDMLSIDVTFAGLIGMSATAHVHCCTALPFQGVAGVATPTPRFRAFPLASAAATTAKFSI